MRASPAFRIQVCRYGTWRIAVASVLALTLAVQAAWLSARGAELPLAASLALVLLDLALVAFAARALRASPVELRWDTRCWRLGPPGAPGAEAPAGTLSVALDLGPWMLLRFDRDAPAPAPRHSWLPVQRRGLEAQWHALRCAVYCPRPAPGTDVGPTPGTGPQ